MTNEEDSEGVTRIESDPVCEMVIASDQKRLCIACHCPNGFVRSSSGIQFRDSGNLVTTPTQPLRKIKRNIFVEHNPHSARTFSVHRYAA